MGKLHIATTLSLPLDWMTLATVVYGARGSGKTSLGAVFAEEVHAAKQRFCAIDLKGDWYGLKSSADGKFDGIPVIVFGGDHQDVPLEDGSGAFVAETVAGLDQSCVIDLEYFSKGRQTRFLAAFFEALYDRNRDPLLLLLDESQRYAPQRTLDPESAKCLGAVEDIVKLGRKHGIGPVLFTQRGSGLNKEVSELCDLLVAFRTPGPLDQDRIKGWLDANTTRAQRDEVMGQLAGLPTGTAVFASGHPHLRLFGVHAVRRRATFDSSATPQIGRRRVEPKKMATPDLEVLRTKMAAAIERAKADDPKALRARIAELEKQLKKPAAVPEVKVERVEVPFVPSGWLGLAETVAGKIGDLAEQIERDLGEFKQKVAKTAVRPDAPPRPMVLASPRARGPGLRALSDGAALRGAQRKVAVVLAQHGTCAKAKVAVISGYSVTGGGFNNVLGALRTAGFITGFDELSLTAEGLAALGAYEPLPTGSDLQSYWRDNAGLSKAESWALQALLKLYPQRSSREDIADKIQELSGGEVTYAFDGGGFNNALGRLRTLELMTGYGDSMVASEHLF